MIYSLHVNVEPEFNLFAMTRDLRNYLNEHFDIPQDLIQHIFLTGSRIDFSLKHESEERYKYTPWFENLTRIAS